MALTAVLAGGDVLHSADRARLDLREPPPPARDGADERVASVGPARTKVAAVAQVRGVGVAVSLCSTLEPRYRAYDLLCRAGLVDGVCRPRVAVVPLAVYFRYGQVEGVAR